MYRPQFPMRPAPAGFVWQPVIFQFDRVNVPAFRNITLGPGEVSGHIPLPLDHDACFMLLAVKIQDGGVNVLLYDPFSNQLMDDFVNPSTYADPLHLTALEGPGIEVPPGAVFAVRLQGR